MKGAILLPNSCQTLNLTAQKAEKLLPHTDTNNYRVFTAQAGNDARLYHTPLPRSGDSTHETNQVSGFYPAATIGWCLLDE
jgi:hypothetical protein